MVGVAGLICGKCTTKATTSSSSTEEHPGDRERMCAQVCWSCPHARTPGMCPACALLRTLLCTIHFTHAGGPAAHCCVPFVCPWLCCTPHTLSTIHLLVVCRWLVLQVDPSTPVRLINMWIDALNQGMVESITTEFTDWIMPMLGGSQGSVQSFNPSVAFAGIPNGKEHKEFKASGKEAVYADASGVADAFQVGDTVVALGLTKAKALNGVQGRVVALDSAATSGEPTSGRVRVLMDGYAEAKAFRPEHLRRAPDETGDTDKGRRLGSAQFTIAQSMPHRNRMKMLKSFWSKYGAFVSHLDLSRAPYVLYGVKYIDLVSLGAFAPRYFLFSHRMKMLKSFWSKYQAFVPRDFLFSCHISVYMR